VARRNDPSGGTDIAFSAMSASGDSHLDSKAWCKKRGMSFTSHQQIRANEAIEKIKEASKELTGGPRGALQCM
jgi:hypothetical protein